MRLWKRKTICKFVYNLHRQLSSLYYEPVDLCIGNSIIYTAII